MGTLSINNFQAIQSFPERSPTRKMKCIALLTAFVVAALAEPEPFFGRIGYAGIGLPVSRYANAYGLNRRTHISSAPVVTRSHVSRVIPAVTAANPVVAPAVPALS